MNCVLQPVIDKLENLRDNFKSSDSQRKYNKSIRDLLAIENRIFEEGATPENIQQICDLAKCKITIYFLLTKEKQVYKPRTTKKRVFTVKFMNTSINHVELYNTEHLT